LTLEFERKDSIDEHESFFLKRPQDPCPHNASPKPVTLCATNTYEFYSYLKPLFYKMFRRMVVDGYIYHKFCKSRGCTCGTNLVAKTINQQLVVKLGTTSPMIVAT
ncbi:hypothetical protein BAE44_0002172, partial [Dichanthelium oligosanthes]